MNEIICITCGTTREIRGYNHPKGAKVTIWICEPCIKNLVTQYLDDLMVLDRTHFKEIE